MGEKSPLGSFEELVLLAIIRLGSQAYGVPIREAVEDATRKATSIGAIYTTLERLEEKGYVRSELGESTPERGGRAKRYFEVSGAGAQALTDAEQARAQLRQPQPAEAQLQQLQPVGGVA